MPSTAFDPAVVVPADRRLAVLAGAGISLDAPSNLLDGASFMRAVLARARPPDVSVDWMLAGLARPLDRLSRPGQVLRFEQLMKALQDSRLDPDLRVLDCLDAGDRPNENHFLLAEMIAAGCLVMTTNFDTLIEAAYARPRAPDAPVLRVAVYSDEFPSEPPSGGPPTLWKLHGSLTRDGVPTRDSIAATLTTVLAGTEHGRRAQFLEAVAREMDLLLVGYSGWDDFDIVPVLASTPSARRLFWVQHAMDEAAPRAAVAGAAIDNPRLQFEADALGRDRVFYNEDGHEQPVRAPENLVLVHMTTTDLLRQVSAALAGGRSYPVDADNVYRFGRANPDAVEAYFDRWAAGFGGQALECWEFLEGAFNLRLQYLERTMARRVQAAIAAERVRRSADPPIALSLMLERFNQLEYRGSEPDAHAKKELKALRRDLPSLIDRLDLAEQVTALRLFGFVVTQLDGIAPGSEVFAQSASLARVHHLDQAELITLIDWQRNYMAHLGDGKPLPLNFDDYAVEQRIAELTDLTGFHPAAFAEDLDYKLWPMLAEDDGDVDGVIARATTIRRYCVDVGDIVSEARASLLLAHAFSHRLGTSRRVAAELLRREELERAFAVRVPDYDDLMALGRWERWAASSGGAAPLRAAVRASMWGEAAAGLRPRADEPADLKADGTVGCRPRLSSLLGWLVRRLFR